MVEHFHKPDQDVDERAPVAPDGFDRHHLRRGSSVSRLANTQPAEPAPT
jgi:hypothetical protein